MDPVLAGTLGGVIGLTIGVLVMWASRRNAAFGDPASTPQTLVPEGVRDVLAVLRSSAVVLNVHDEVVSTSPSAVSYGLVRHGELVHDELAQLVRAVRHDGGRFVGVTQYMQCHPSRLDPGCQKFGDRLHH